MVVRATGKNSLAPALVQERNEQKNAQPESEQSQSKPSSDLFVSVPHPGCPTSSQGALCGKGEADTPFANLQTALCTVPCGTGCPTDPGAHPPGADTIRS